MSGRASAARTAAAAVVVRPRLWRETGATLRRLAPTGWWRRPPFLPVPDATYWKFRMHTAYGDQLTGRPTRADVVDYLEWCQRVRPGRR
ncbi:MAG: hypothetical protein ACRDV6_07945 [Acidimicrobiales bacterium]